MDGCGPQVRRGEAQEAAGVGAVGPGPHLYGSGHPAHLGPMHLTMHSPPAAQHLLAQVRRQV